MSRTLLYLLMLTIITTVATQSLSAKSKLEKVSTHLKNNKHAYAGGLAAVSLLNLLDMAVRGKKFNKTNFKSILAKQNRGTTLRLAVGTLLPLILAGTVEWHGREQKQAHFQPGSTPITFPNTHTTPQPQAEVPTITPEKAISLIDGFFVQKKASAVTSHKDASEKVFNFCQQLFPWLKKVNSSDTNCYNEKDIDALSAGVLDYGAQTTFRALELELKYIPQNIKRYLTDDSSSVDELKQRVTSRIQQNKALIDDYAVTLGKLSCDVGLTESGTIVLIKLPKP